MLKCKYFLYDINFFSDKMIVDYHPLMCEQMRNINISSEIIGNLSMGNIEKSDSDMKSGMPYAVATLDGTLMLIKNEEIIWLVRIQIVLIFVILKILHH